MRNWLKALYDTCNAVYAPKMNKRTNFIPKNLIAHICKKFVELAKVYDRSKDVDDIIY